MIITRAPYRISFFGGGTDYYTWYEEHGGDVLSTTINHYNYISCRYFPPFHAEYRNRIAWNILEYPNDVNEIQHNAIREALKHYNVTQGVEISNQCDLPARSGLGSSSCFCAGLIQSIFALIVEMITKILPSVSENVAKPISAIDNMNVYGGDASTISGNVPAVIKQTFDVVKSATGVDMSNIMKAESYDAKVNKNIDIRI